MRYPIIITAIVVAACWWQPVKADEPKPVVATSTGTPIEKAKVVEELVAIVGNAPIMLSEVERYADMVLQNRKQYGVRNNLTPKEEAIETLLLQKLLVQQAKADSLDKNFDKATVAITVEEHLQRLIEQAGSVKLLEKQFGKAIFQIRKDVEEQLFESQLSQMMQGEVRRKTKVSGADVAAFFDKIPKDSMPLVPKQFIYSQIMKVPPATEARKFKIREQLLEFRNRILKGEKLSVLARLYSQDYGTASNGGDMEIETINQVVGPFGAAIDELKPGQISGIVETEFGMHLVELVYRKGDYIKCRHLLLKPEFTIEEINQATAELDSLALIIREQKATMSDLAAKYSEDAESRHNGGRVFNIKKYFETQDLSQASTRFGADEVDVIDFRYLDKMQPGDVSPCFSAVDLKGNQVFKIVQLDKIIPAHPASLEADFSEISTAATNDKQTRELEKWIDKTILDMYIYLAPEYRTIDFQHKGWLEMTEKLELQTVDKMIPEGFFDQLLVKAKNDIQATDLSGGADSTQLIPLETPQSEVNPTSEKPKSDQKTPNKTNKQRKANKTK